MNIWKALGKALDARRYPPIHLAEPLEDEVEQPDFTEPEEWEKENGN